MEVNILRVLLAKIGLDGHDRGLKIIAKLLRDNGVEVIYLGLRQKAENIVEAAIQEDVDLIGISVLSGTHKIIAKKLMNTIKQKKAKFKIFFGGIIPDNDIIELKNIGVDEVFPVGTSLNCIIENIKGKKLPKKPLVETFNRSDDLRKEDNASFTSSGIPIKEIYTLDDLRDFDEKKELSLPGKFPYTRGPYETMYRGNLWTMRQYSGFGSASDTNNRYKYLIKQGQTGLSVAFDLPTQLGYDSDNKTIAEEVGRVGVAIDTIEDMYELFKEIPLDKISVNFTINSTAIVILAMYVIMAKERGYKPRMLSGTIQNDMIKEFISRNTFIFPLDASVKIAGDIIEYSSNLLPKFNPISCSGYHIRELGANAIQEVATTLSAAIVYTEEAIRRGLDVDSFAPRISFHFACTQDFFEEIAKFRAARRMWAKIMKNKFHAKDDKSCRLRVFSGGNGTSLTANEPFNNLIRCAFVCLSGVLGGAQAIHVAGYDEAFSIPSKDSVKLSLRTQQILAYETGITKTVDPLAGSYYIESLTNEIEDRTEQYMIKIEKLGGIIECIKNKWILNEVINNAFKEINEIEKRDKIVIGVNKFAEDEMNKKIIPEKIPKDVLKNQVNKLNKIKKDRDNTRLKNTLQKLYKNAKSGNNIFPQVIDAVEARASLGEIIGELKKVFGECNET